MQPPPPPCPAHNPPTRGTLTAAAPQVTVMHGSVVRGDLNNISIGPFSTIQENAVIHAARCATPPHPSPAASHHTHTRTCAISCFKTRLVHASALASCSASCT